MTAHCDFRYPATYKCEVLQEIPGAGALDRHFYPKGQTTGGNDGILLRVTPEAGKPWIGMFAFGRFGPKGASMVLGLPDPDKLCVVARGAGYIVSTTNPQIWERIGAVPIIAIRAIPAAGIVAFANFTELLAYDLEGFRWRTQRLSWDSLNLIEVTESSIIGEYWDIRVDGMRRFEVDLNSGDSRGGIGDEPDL